MGAQKLPPWAPAAMAGWRALGETYQQIGDRFGVTRERVRQILAKIGKDGRLPRPEFCVVLGCDRARWYCSRQYCSMHASRVKLTGDPGPAGPLNSPAPEFCVNCGEPMAPHGQANGSGKAHQGRGRCQACYSRMRYAAWTPEQRARHLRLCKRWRQRHPKRAREIQQNAQRAYYLRQKARRQQEQQP